MKHVPKLLLNILLLFTFLSINTTVYAANYALRNTETEGKFIYSLNAGETITGTVLIDNREQKSIALKIYPADPAPSASGTFAIKTDIATQNNVGLWVKFDESTIKLGPLEKKTVNFTITIPEKTPPGTFRGGIALQLIEDADAPKENTMGVVSISRTANPLIIEIPGEKIHSFEWVEFKHSLNNRYEHIFNMEFNNNGNTLVVANGEITISSPEMEEDDKIVVSDITLGNNDTFKVEKKWNKMPFYGNYHAVANITFSEFDVLKGEIINPESFSREFDFFIFPWKEFNMLVGIILAIIALIIVRILVKRSIRKNSKPYTVKDGETLVQIAAKAGVSWKKVAKVNKIKAPYTVTKGQTILIPQK